MTKSIYDYTQAARVSISFNPSVHISASIGRGDGRAVLRLSHISASRPTETEGLSHKIIMHAQQPTTSIYLFLKWKPNTSRFERLH
jgi:hypothetical protein